MVPCEQKWSVPGLGRSLLIAQVKFEPESSSSHESSSSQDSSFYFSIFFLLFISSGCYFRLHNDVLVANRKNYNCLVCNVLRYRSLEPSGTICRYDSLPSVAVQRYTASLSVHEFSKKIKTCICLHVK